VRAPGDVRDPCVVAEGAGGWVVHADVDSSVGHPEAQRLQVEAAGEPKQCVGVPSNVYDGARSMWRGPYYLLDSDGFGGFLRQGAGLIRVWGWAVSYLHPVLICRMGRMNRAQFLLEHRHGSCMPWESAAIALRACVGPCVLGLMAWHGPVWGPASWA